MIPGCLAALVREAQDRWTCWWAGGANPDHLMYDALYFDHAELQQQHASAKAELDVADRFVKSLIDTTSNQRHEINTLKAALAECMRSKALAEENADRCDLDLRDVLFLRGGMREHPSFGGDQ